MSMWTGIRIAAGLATALVLTAGASPSEREPALVADRPPAVDTDGTLGPIRPLPVDADADYQLGGVSPVPLGARVVVRDRADPPAGEYAVCYVNAFQTQPGEGGWWRRRHPQLLLRHHGRVVADRDWPGELLLDIRTVQQREAVSTIVGGWMRACADRGFDAVKPDNLDSWTRSHGRIARTDAIAYSRLLVRAAHSHGLAIAQKNAVDLVSRRASVGWDFAVAEECHVYRECRRYLSAYDGAVVEIEYDDAGGRRNFRAACRSHGDSIAIVFRDRNLVPRGHPGHVYDAC